MKGQTTIIDENGIELVATYDLEHTDSQVEEGHGYHEVGDYDSVELIGVDLYIDGKVIPLLPLLTKRMKHSIIDKLEIY